MATTIERASETAQAHDTFPINGTDYIEFYVGNAKQAAHFYRSAFGFQLVGYRGPETGVRDRASYLLQQDKIRFVLTTPIRPDLSDDPEVGLQVKADRFRARARTATPDERAELWQTMASIWPDYDTYQTKTDREIPVVVLEREG